MPKIRYSAKENKRVGTHSYYAQAIAEDLHPLPDTLVINGVKYIKAEKA